MTSVWNWKIAKSNVDLWIHKLARGRTLMLPPAGFCSISMQLSPVGIEHHRSLHLHLYTALFQHTTTNDHIHNIASGKFAVWQKRPSHSALSLIDLANHICSLFYIWKLYCVNQKRSIIFVYNFPKYWSIFKIISWLGSVKKIFNSHHTLMLLNHVVNYKKINIVQF